MHWSKTLRCFQSFSNLLYLWRTESLRFSCICSLSTFFVHVSIMRSRPSTPYLTEHKWVPETLLMSLLRNQSYGWRSWCNGCSRLSFSEYLTIPWPSNYNFSTTRVVSRVNATLFSLFRNTHSNNPLFLTRLLTYVLPLFEFCLQAWNHLMQNCFSVENTGSKVCSAEEQQHACNFAFAYCVTK